MKKLSLFLAALVCALVLSPAAHAQETFADIDALYQYWVEHGYPDYVGDVVSTDGSAEHVTVLLVNDDGTYAEQIRAMLADDSGLTIETASYSSAAMMAVHEEIYQNDLLHSDKVYEIGIGWTVKDGEITGFGPSGKETRVVVGVDESVYDAYVAKFAARYGDMVVVEVSEPVILSISTPAPPQPGSILVPSPLLRPHRNFTLPLLLCLFVLSGGGLFLFRRAPLSAAAQAAQGDTVSLSPRPRRAELVAAVKNSAQAPPDALFEKILSQLDDAE